ncbi:MAG: hypothetical protein ACYCTE_11855 [Acidimicrobiales bacterium]
MMDVESGDLELDSWLVRDARVALQMDSARTFLLMLDKRVAGYFALTVGGSPVNTTLAAQQNSLVRPAVSRLSAVAAGTRRLICRRALSMPVVRSS